MTEFDPETKISQFRVPLRLVRDFLAGRPHVHLVMIDYAVAFIEAYRIGRDPVARAHELIIPPYEFNESSHKAGRRFLSSLVRKGFLHYERGVVDRYTLTPLGNELLSMD